MNCVNIKLWDILDCFHYILNAPRNIYHNGTLRRRENVLIYFNRKYNMIVKTPGVKLKPVALCMIHGNTRKSHKTITGHQEGKLNKATSSLFPIKMVAKLELT